MELKHFLSPTKMEVGQTVSINGKSYTVYNCRKLKLTYYGSSSVLSILLASGVYVNSKNKTAFFRLFGWDNQRAFMNVYMRNTSFVNSEAVNEYYFIDLTAEFYIFNPL